MIGVNDKADRHGRDVRLPAQFLGIGHLYP